MVAVKIKQLYVTVTEKREKMYIQVIAIIGTEVNFVELQVSVPKGSVIP